MSKQEENEVDDKGLSQFSNRFYMARVKEAGFLFHSGSYPWLPFFASSFALKQKFFFLNKFRQYYFRNFFLKFFNNFLAP